MSTSVVGDWARLLSLSPKAALAAIGLSPKTGWEDFGDTSFAQLADDVEAACLRAGIRVVFAGDPEFPRRLLLHGGAPPLLFMSGQAGTAGRAVAMVGSRRPEGGFLLVARGLARQIAEAGVAVVSGAAEGVDEACHEGALAVSGETLAFVAGGLDSLGAGAARRVQRIIHGGGSVWSEFPPGVAPTKGAFPRRNRWIAAVADAVWVLRAGEASGSLYTAAAAREMQIPVFAMPGPLGKSVTEGCERLIATGNAQPATRADTLLRALDLVPAASKGTCLPSDASATAQQLFAELPAQGATLEGLEGRFPTLPSWALRSALVELELLGRVVQHPGKQYEKV
ncbi:MAG: DNA-processing protein DprA [Myxococcaceae bacterium]